MTLLARLPGLQMADALKTVSSSERPTSWPPRDDFPIVVDEFGVVICRYGDPIWDLTAWAGKKLTLNFGERSTRGAKISPENAATLRLITAWWMYGPSAVRTPSTLAMRHEVLKPLFAICSAQQILATDISRYSNVIDSVGSNMRSSAASYAVSLLHDLWSNHEDLGFVILDPQGLTRLNSHLKVRASIQTAYIPPRIWAYQVERLRLCLVDYLEHKERIEACYKFCLDAYAHNAGGNLSTAFAGLPQHHLPFSPKQNYERTRGSHSRRYYGPFKDAAERFDIYRLLERWVNVSDQNGIKAFSSYLTLVSYVGLVYSLNFSLMRIDEGMRLRSDCYSVERDDIDEDIHTLSGVTTKTTRDRDAKWIVSPSVELAITATRSIASLRMTAARSDPRLSLSDEDISNPLLQTWAHEPWGSSRVSNARKRHMAYGSLLRFFPKLLDSDSLRITEEDMVVANNMTFGLNPATYAVGKVWPIAFHQLRRTGAVNMLSTGLVSEPSLQMQLKHASRSMSRYYGQNHYRLHSHLDEEAKGFYIREMYGRVASEFVGLQSDRFVSPYGSKRKDQILATISGRDHTALLKNAKSGKISYRETLLGGCAIPGPPCSLGGISNVSGCMGYRETKPCEWCLLDKNKVDQASELRLILVGRLSKADPESALQESLAAQLESVERALHVHEASNS